MSRSYTMHDNVYLAHSTAGTVILSCDKELHRILDGVFADENLGIDGDMLLGGRGVYNCTIECCHIYFAGSRMEPPEYDFEYKLIDARLVLEYAEGFCTALPDQ